MSAELTRFRRPAAGLAVAAVAVLGSAAPGWAHAAQLSAFPADGSAVAQVPDAVVVTFNEAPQELGTQASADGPDGRIDTTLAISGNSVEIDLPDNAPAGRYTVRWRVTSADGHPIQGSSTFTADQPAGGGSAVGQPTQTPDPNAPTDDPAQATGQAAGGQASGAQPTDAQAPTAPADAAATDGAVAVSDPTPTNGSQTVNPDESPADSADDGETDGLSGTTVLIIGLLVALGGGAGVWLALANRKKD